MKTETVGFYLFLFPWHKTAVALEVVVKTNKTRITSISIMRKYQYISMKMAIRYAVKDHLAKIFVYKRSNIDLINLMSSNKLAGSELGREILSKVIKLIGVDE